MSRWYFKPDIDGHDWSQHILQPYDHTLVIKLRRKLKE